LRGASRCTSALIVLGGLGVFAPWTPAHADTLPAAAGTSLYVAWVDSASPGFTSTAIHVVNPGATRASGSVTLPGLWSAGFSADPGAATYVFVPQGVIGGPLLIQSTVPVIASVRVRYGNSINEMPARSSAQAATDAWFNWFDNASPGFALENIHVVNPGSASTTGMITLPGHPDITFSLAAQTASAFSFPASIGGPVHIHASAGVLASARTLYRGSFWEAPALDANTAGSDLWFDWYDQASPAMSIDNLHLLNPGTATASGIVSMPGQAAQSFSIGAGQEWYVAWSSGIGGPVHIQVTSGSGVVASQRLTRHAEANGTSYLDDFSEWTGRRTADAQIDTWFPWYDAASPYFIDDLHITNPGGAPATFSVNLPGQPSASLIVSPGSDVYFGFAGGIGGPLHVTVTSGPAVLVVQRAFIDPPAPVPPPPTSIVLGVPWYHQQYSLSCEEASLRMALAYRGIGVSDQQVLNQIGIDWTHYWAGPGGGDPFRSFVGDPNGSEIANTGYGTYWPTIQAAAGAFGGGVVQAGNLPPSTVYSRVLQGHPTITWVTFDWGTPARHDYTAYDGASIPYAGPDEHAVVVVGVTPDSVLVNDPDRGRYWVSKNQFEPAYSVYGDMAVVNG
jgi:uncharacterized protein YvpB